VVGPRRLRTRRPRLRTLHPQRAVFVKALTRYVPYRPSLARAPWTLGIAISPRLVGCCCAPNSNPALPHIDFHPSLHRSHNLTVLAAADCFPSGLSVGRVAGVRDAWRHRLRHCSLYQPSRCPAPSRAQAFSRPPKSNAVSGGCWISSTFARGASFAGRRRLLCRQGAVPVWNR
jgi:hypothetical protein